MTNEPKKFKTKVVRLTQLSESGYELTLDRQGLEFSAGQLLIIHGRDDSEDRSYTISSGEKDEHLQILFRHIPHGKLTPRLSKLNTGDEIEISGPYGEFVIRDPSKPIIFIATGTGVAPCRAYIHTFKDLKLTLIHGTRIAQDLFYRKEFESYTYYPCVSRETGTGFHGRVTPFCESFAFPPDSHFHLCGANEMIFDIQMMLKKRGIDRSRIFTEAYYYRLYS